MRNEEEKDLRLKILSLVEEYYNKFHQPTKFSPHESRIPYAGRVYDANEMKNVVESGLDFWLTAGRYCQQFETEFAQTIGKKFSLLVNSGSSANLVAFSALTSSLLGKRAIKKGDEVITAATGFPTTVNPIIQFGAIPVFVDVELNDGTYNVSPETIRRAITENTKAVFIAHTLGNPFQVAEIKSICEEHGLWLVEDNCDALGSEYNGKKTGTFGDIATSSFYPPHHLTMGEGGAVYMDDPLLKRAAESFRDWGRDCWCASGQDNTCKRRFKWRLGELPEGYDHKYVYRHFGYNLKVTEMQAAIGIAQLQKLNRFTELRRRNFALLSEGLKKYENEFILPKATPGSNPSWFGFPLTLRESSLVSRGDLVNFLESRKIQTRMLFAGNMLLHPMFDEMRASQTGYRVVGDLSVANRIAKSTFWLGVYPGLSEEMIDYVIGTFDAFFKQ